MKSTLGRLFTFAKAVDAAALENFTTEALAGAIRADPDPFVAVLHELGIAPREPEQLVVETQVPIVGPHGNRRLDLVIVFGPSGARQEVWIEVKVNAGESGDQLSAYSAAIAALPEGDRPVLIVLGSRRLRDDVPFVSWQRVRRSIINAPTSSQWSDLKLYLEEIGMADAHSEPVATSDANALSGAVGLLGKTARIIRPFAETARTIWPESRWPTDERKLRRKLGRTLATHGCFAIDAATNFRAGVSVGVYHEPASNDAWLGLWLWARPSWVRERDQIWKAAAAGGLDAAWTRSPSGWRLLGCFRRLLDFPDHDTATLWLTGRLTELRDAHVLERLAKLGSLEANERDEELKDDDQDDEER
jgi:hypothetical protein